MPGREPNVVEKADVLEDYILADATVVTTGKAPTTGKRYKVEKIDDSKLSAHGGKKVEVVGRIDTEPNEVPALTTPQRRSPSGTRSWESACQLMSRTRA